MKNLQQFLILSLTLFLTACGGGGGNGGGGGSPPPPPPPPPPPTSSISAAEIVFPWQSSTANSQVITVGGTATDGEGIASVTINGVAATVTTVSSVPGAVNKASLNTVVTWSAEVTLAAGDNQLSVSVEDSNGEVTDNLDSVAVKYVEVPITFTLDPDGTRVVGLSFVQTPAGFEQNLVQYNYATEEQTVFDELRGSPELTCFRRFDDEYLHLSGVTGTWNLFAYDMSTGSDTLLAEIPDTALDGGAGYRAPSIRELVCGDTHTSAYLLINYGETGATDLTRARILEIDLATANVTTLADSISGGPAGWMVAHIALAEDRIVASHFFAVPSPLISVSLADGTVTELTPGLDASGLVVHPDIPNSRVYVATFDGVDEVNLATLSKQNISPSGPDDPLAFAQVRAIGLDAANNRVVIGDSDLDMLIGVDLTTGERSEFLARNAGTGTKLVVPRAFAITADNSRAYVVDDGGNVAERLFEIDLNTGDRRVIGDINRPFNFTASGLALDEAGNRVFISFNDMIQEIDLETEQVRTVVDVDSTALISVRGLLLDPANNRLLIGDPGNDGVYAMDLTTNAVEVVSQENVRGSGPAFGVVISLSGPTTNGDIYIAGQASETVTRVNLATGDREALITPCNPGGSSDLPGLDQVLLNEETDELLMLAARIYDYDLVSGSCSRLPGSGFFLKIANASADQLLAITFGSLMQIDRETGEIVFVSK